MPSSNCQRSFTREHLFKQKCHQENPFGSHMTGRLCTYRKLLLIGPGLIQCISFVGSLRGGYKRCLGGGGGGGGAYI